MRLLLISALLLVTTLLTFGLAQEAPEGYVSKEAIEKLFKATQGGGEIFIGELSPLFSNYDIPTPEGFELLGSLEQNYSGPDGVSQVHARAFFNKLENGNIQTLHTYFTENNWEDLLGPQTTLWGFVGPQLLVSDYGTYCKGNAVINFGTYTDDETLLELSIEENSNINDGGNSCEQQGGMYAFTTLSGEAGIKVPDLQLTPPATSVALVAETLPYSPIPTSELQGIKLPGGWGSRTTLSTKLAPSRVLGLYNLQMKEAGWSMGRTNADEINTWSEWTLTDDAGQKWLATLNVTHHESFENLLMPVLVVLTVE